MLLLTLLEILDRRAVLKLQQRLLDDLSDGFNVDVKLLADGPCIVITDKFNNASTGIRPTNDERKILLKLADWDAYDYSMLVDMMKITYHNNVARVVQAHGLMPPSQ